MSFLEFWQQWHEVKRTVAEAERRARIEQARASWVGRLVRYYDPKEAADFADLFISEEGWVYGEVMQITDDERVEVLVAWREGRAVTTTFSLAELGTRCVLVDGLPEMGE